jgi:hypothetical protein
MYKLLLLKVICSLIYVCSFGQSQPIEIKLVAISCPKVNDGLSDDEDVFGKILYKVSESPYIGLSEKHGSLVAWRRGIANNVKVKNSSGPKSSGAYSFIGDTGLNFAFFATSRDPVEARKKFTCIQIELSDEEFQSGRAYDTRIICIRQDDILNYLKSRSTFRHDSYDSKHRLFKIETTEKGQTNKLIVWFDFVPN